MIVIPPSLGFANLLDRIAKIVHVKSQCIFDFEGSRNLNEQNIPRLMLKTYFCLSLSKRQTSLISPLSTRNRFANCPSDLAKLNLRGESNVASKRRAD